MARAYKVIDADGHILEPIDLWDRYMDPAYREHAPRLIIGDNGKERLLVEGKILGNPKGLGRLGAVGARDGSVPADTMMYKDGRPGGFDPHERIKDLDLDGIDAAFLYPSIGLFSELCRTRSWRQRCAVRTTDGSRITASRIRIVCSGSPCCRCNRSIWPSRRCASLENSSG